MTTITLRRVALLLLWLALAAVGVWAGADALTLTQLRAQLADGQAWVQAAPAQAMAVYGAVYVLATALSVPGATVLTLAGGALFGLGWGLVLVSLASTLGATLAFAMARYVAAPWVQQRWGDKLAPVHQGIARDGALYVLTLRLVPLMPFFVVNLLLGLTRLPVRTYVWASQLGMLPATVVYVNAGQALGDIGSVSDVASPRVLGSLVLLGLLPWLAKGVVSVLKRRQLLAKWKKPACFDANLLVVGGGAAGLVSAYIGATLQAKVTLVEGHAMGGDCLNTGCVPSKALLRAAHEAAEASPDRRTEVSKRDPVTWHAALARIQHAVDAIAPNDSVARYQNLGVEVLQGWAQLVDPWTLQVTHPDGSQTRRTGRAVILATGASPVVPPLPAVQSGACPPPLTSETVWAAMRAWPTAPDRLVIWGGGAVACEFAQAFAHLGTRVTMVVRGPRLLRGECEDAAALIATRLQADGVTLLLGHTVTDAQLLSDGSVQLSLSETSPAEGQTGKTLSTDHWLCALGRTPRLHGLGLEALGLDPSAPVDEALRTRLPHIAMAGDVTDRWQLTHAASQQAWVAAVNALVAPFKTFKLNDRWMPRVLYTQPELASVGLTPEAAQAQGVPFERTRWPMAEVDRAVAEGQTQGFIEVLTVPGQDRLLGVTIVAERAGEMLAPWVLAGKHGLGMNAMLATVHAYPGWAEANQRVSGAWKRAHAPQWVMPWLARWHAWRRS